MAYLCFDIGSTALKAAIIAEDGELLGISRRRLLFEAEGSGVSGMIEADPAAWIEAAFSAGAEAISKAREGPGPGARHNERSIEVRALSVSGNGPTLFPADADGLPLGPALSWLDRRAVREAEEVSALAGRTIDPTFSLPKALRLWRNADSTLRSRIRWFFSCPEYLLFALCGEALTYLPHPGYEPYFWNQSMLEALGLPGDRFPRFVPPSIEAGGLLRSAAGRLGLTPGLPVVTGFPDFLAAIVGSASVQVGIACDRSGTSEALNLCAHRPFPSRALLSLPHPVPGLWNLSGGVSTAGAALEWLAGCLGFGGAKKNEAAVARLLAEAWSSPPGARGLVFLPYLAGERAPLWDPSRRGAFVGLKLEHSRSDLAKAAVESLAYGLRLASELAIGEALPFSLLRVSGQAASDDLLCQLKADILGVPVEPMRIADCELVGDAAACALALGEASTLAEAALSLARIRLRFEPRLEAGYEAAFASFKSSLAALGPVDAAR